MTWEKELTLNTSVLKFEAWLDRYRLLTLPDIIYLDDEKNLSVTGAPTFDHEFSGYRTHTIRASIAKTDPNDPGIEIHSFPFPVIEIELFEPADNRVVIKLKCIHHALLPYVSTMLDKINQMWPETQRESDQGLTGGVGNALPGLILLSATQIADRLIDFLAQWKQEHTTGEPLFLHAWAANQSRVEVLVQDDSYQHQLPIAIASPGRRGWSLALVDSNLSLFPENSLVLNLVNDLTQFFDRELGVAGPPPASETEKPKLKKTNIDPTDERILAIIQKNIKITDGEIAQQLNLSRQAVNTRRRALEKAGYTVRMSRQI